MSTQQILAVYIDTNRIVTLRNSFVNLALPSFVQSEPMPCKKNTSDPAKGLKYYPEGWTLWDHFLIDEGDITFQQLLDFFKVSLSPVMQETLLMQI